MNENEPLSPLARLISDITQHLYRHVADDMEKMAPKLKHLDGETAMRVHAAALRFAAQYTHEQIVNRAESLPQNKEGVH